MGKKKILALVMTGVMLFPTVAFAEGNHHNSSNDGKQVISQEKSSESDRDHSEKQDGQDQKNGQDKKDAQDQNKSDENKQQNQQNREAKKQQIQAFKSQMRAKHETMKQIRQQTRVVRQQVETKTEQLKAIIADIEAGNKTLPQDMLDALLAKTDSIKQDAQAVKATAGLSKDSSDVQDKVNKQDFNNALASMDKVIAKLQARLNALNKLNSDLDNALAIADLATIPAPTTTTPTATTTPTTSGSTTTPTDTTSGSTTSTGTTSTDTTTNTTPDTTTTTSGN